MRVLVTGASGFIGRAVASNLSAKGHEVWGFDRHLKDIPGAERMIEGDIRDRRGLELALYQADGVINLAGVLGTSELLAATREAVELNVLAAVDLMDICLAQEKPLVQITVGNHTWPSVYPITKVAAEKLALAYGRDRGLKVAVVRAMNAYGPYQKHAPIKKLVPNLIRWAMLGQPAEIYGDGRQIMDPIHVSDVAEILVRALWYAALGKEPTIFEAGTGLPNSMSVNRMSHMVWRAVRLDGTRYPDPIHIPMRPGEPIGSATVADVSTLDPLNLRASIPLEMGLENTARWYKANPGFLGLVAVKWGWREAA